MSKVIAKIILLLIVLVVSLLPAFGILFLVLMENQRFDFTMLIPFGITVLGICSTIFHVKTVSFYKNLSQDRLLKKPSSLFLGLNFGFAAVNILFGLLFTYLLYFKYPASIVLSDDPIILLVVVPIFLGCILFLEAFYMKRKLDENKEKMVISEIQDIKGNTNDLN